ncbi:unnamed protein product [Leptidea sinapis]|uniref:BRCA1-associated ATM activator 1 n=1 Tax=Leptidea sinapis TaxID=189913 RepID=A0A5E4PMQ3_9NEOP|nr:unnamed protein product [Leptidea sinapis]
MEIVNKIKLMFAKIAEADYVMNNYYVENLFTKLSNDDPALTDLLLEALNSKNTYHSTVKVFLVKLLAFLSQSEINFTKINTKIGCDLTEAFNQINATEINPSLRVAYMEVALALLQHNSGVHWLLESGAWRNILTLCYEKRTVFTLRQTYRYVSLFVWKLKDLDNDAGVKSVLEFILRPMSETDLIRKETISSEEEDEICKTFEPMLQMLLSVISNEEQIRSPNCIVHYLLNEFKVMTYLYVILDRLRREDIWIMTTKLLFWLVISKIFLIKPMTPHTKYEKEDLMEVIVTYFNTINKIIQRRYVTLVFDYSNACNLIWGRVWVDQTLEPLVCNYNDKVRKRQLHMQLLTINLVPCLVFVTIGRKSPMSGGSIDRVNEFILELMQLSCEHTARTVYALRDLMHQLDIPSVTLQSVRRLTCLKNHLNNEQANLVFQTMFYVLKEFDPIDEYGETKPGQTYEDDHDRFSVLAYVMDTLLYLVNNYNINWHDTVEVVCLHTVVCNILKKPNLTCKKFLHPNLSLLLDTKPGSSLHVIGKLMYLKMHDLNWEIRDSALELLLVCTEISFISKYGVGRLTRIKQILSNNLINVAMSMALNDHEYYVRVSALRCVGAASKVAALWVQLQAEYPNVQDLLISILRNNQEGIVRKEACNVLCDIYQNIKHPPSQQSVLYEHLVAASLDDFHWEVQLSALKFWKCVIQSFLREQGMLDGKFPRVTFSKESRKIVTLTDKELQKRLTKTLDELASIGCLTVLVKLLHDDSELEVMDLALSISTELFNTLETYKVPGSLRPNEQDPASIDELFKQKNQDQMELDRCKVESIGDPENIIEGILGSDDMSLLADMYQKHMNIENVEAGTEVNKKIFKIASPYIFVTFMRQNDFKRVIEQKRNWRDGIRSVSSLLDDILGIYEVNSEANDLDCY